MGGWGGIKFGDMSLFVITSNFLDIRDCIILIVVCCKVDREHKEHLNQHPLLINTEMISYNKMYKICGGCSVLHKEVQVMKS